MEALEAKGIQYRESQSRPNELWLCCPFCVEQGTSPDSRFRLSVNIETGWMHCFNAGCDKSSRTAEYTWRELQRALETGTLEAAYNLGRNRKPRITKVRLPEDFRVIKTTGKRDYWHNFAYEYLKKRKVKDWQIEEREIGYSMVEMFRYRIVIPVYYKGKLKGLVGRTFVRDLEPPYLNSIGEKVMYVGGGTGRGRTAIVTEGVFDALRVGGVIGGDGSSFPDTDSLAGLGTNLTDKQYGQLERYDRIISWFDPDEAGVKGTIKLGKKLQQMGKEHLVVPVTPGDPDPSDWSGQGILRVLKQAKPYTEELGLKLRMEMLPVE